MCSLSSVPFQREAHASFGMPQLRVMDLLPFVANVPGFCHTVTLCSDFACPDVFMVRNSVWPMHLWIHMRIGMPWGPGVGSQPHSGLYVLFTFPTPYWVITCLLPILFNILLNVINVNVLFCHLNYKYFGLSFLHFALFGSDEWSFEHIKFFLLGMTVMGKENLTILKKRNYRISFKVALDFIFLKLIILFLKTIFSELSICSIFPVPPHLNEFKTFGSGVMLAFFRACSELALWDL